MRIYPPLYVHTYEILYNYNYETLWAHGFIVRPCRSFLSLDTKSVLCDG